MISIRPAKPDDGDAIERVGKLAILKLASGPYPTEVIEAWSEGSWTPKIQAAGSPRHCFVAVHADEIVGFAIWVPHREEPKTAHIKSVYVHPDWARRGIGTKLIKRAEQDALSSGYERFTVGASLNGLPFYAAVGYRKEEAQRVKIAPGIDMRFELMRKPLQKDRFP